MVHPVSPSVLTESESVEEEVPVSTSEQNIESSFISLLSEHTEDSSCINEEELEGAVGFSTDSLELDDTRQQFSLDDSDGTFPIHDTPRCRRNSSMFSYVDDSSEKLEEPGSYRLLNESERVRQQTADSGVYLFQGFMRDEFTRQRISEPVFFNSAFQPAPAFNSSLASDVIEASYQIRHLSEKFANSPLRDQVLAQAQQVDLRTLTLDSFSDILYGLFQEGGVTWERVIVLFFFCADVSLRAVKEKLFGQFANILHWSIRFFSLDVFTRWVQDHGGWVKILQDTIDHTYKIAVIGFCTVGIIALAALLWKSK